MKTNWRALRGACLFLATLALAVGSVQGEPGTSTPTVRVDAVVNAHTVRIDAKATGPFEYTTYRPSENLFVVDLAGVSTAGPSGARVLKSDLVSSYRLLRYQAGERSIVRVEVLMRSPVEPRVERQGQDRLTLIFEGPAAAEPAAARVAEPVKAPPVAQRAAATAIEQVEVTRQDGQTLVRVAGNGRLAYEELRLGNPSRLVLDFAGARVGRSAKRTIASDLLPVRGVRLGQHKPDVARVVVDLEREVPYSVSTQGNVLTVAFGSTVSNQAAVETGNVTVPAAAPPPSPAVSPVEPKEETAMQQMALPQTLTQPAAALAAPVAASPAEPAPAPPAEAKPTVYPAQEEQKYTGEPISVNFKDIDLKDFFRLIHEISGLNVVLDPTVRGTVTLVLDSVPWDQALEIVLRNNNLDKQLEGNVLRIATRDTLKREADTRRDLIKAQAEAVDQVTTTRVLSYAKASAIQATLKRFLSARGEILADERSNTLIIRDIPSVLPEVDNLIRQLDRKSQQVEIEARVVAASRSFSREIGTQFGFATSATSGRTVFGGLVGRGAFVSPVERGPGLPIPPLVASGTNSIPLNVNLGAAAPTSGVTFAHSEPNLALDFIISAAESKGVGKLLSKPKVITQNNEKATVKQGTKIPIQTVINNTISTQFIDAVLKLEVTPQITAEGTVYMEVLVENTAIDEGIERVQGIPALATQAAETKVLINDGGTVVVGGVIISSQRTTVAQVPLFGSIPVIGHLFKRTTVSTSSQELLFFVTPRIIPG